MKENSFIEGTIIASIAILITKVLGVLYVIPFYAIIGENGGVLYSYAYNIYNLFLNISTAGIPVAISMIISEYTSLKQFDAKKRAYQIAKKLIAIISIVAFLILFIFAEKCALFFLNGVSGGNNIKDVALVIRAISFCLLIIPFLSVIRGFLQGNKIIAPTSYSQVIEQVIRIIVILVGSYLAINIFKTSIPIGVAVALTGAFFGGVFAYCYLKRKITKNPAILEEPIKKDNISNKEITKKIIYYCIPLIITSIVANLYDLVDMKLIIKGLYLIGFDANTCELISSIIATWAPKICMIIVAISMGLTTSLIPHLINSYVKKDYKDVNKKLNQAIATMLAITVPMGIGLSFLANEVYTIFYDPSTYGTLILRYLAILNIFTGVLTVLNTALQGVKKFKIIYLNSIVGLSINAILDIPLIILFDKIGIYPFYGTITATIIGCIISYAIVFHYLNKDFKFSYKPLFNIIKKMIIPTISLVSFLILVSFIKIPNKTILIIISLIFKTGCGAAIYLYLFNKNHGLEEVFGKDFLTSIKNKFKRKK